MDTVPRPPKQIFKAPTFNLLDDMSSSEGEGNESEAEDKVLEVSLELKKKKDGVDSKTVDEEEDVILIDDDEVPETPVTAKEKAVIVSEKKDDSNEIEEVCIVSKEDSTAIASSSSSSLRGDTGSTSTPSLPSVGHFNVEDEGGNNGKESDPAELSQDEVEICEDEEEDDTDSSPPPTHDDYRLMFDKLPQYRSIDRKMKRHFDKLDLPTQLDLFVKSVAQTEEGWNLRRRAIDDLLRVLKRDFPQCSLFPFGSFLTGLTDDSGDIDLVMVRNVQARDILTHVECKQMVNRIANILRRPYMRASYDNIVPIRGAKIPIVRFHHVQTAVQFDISFGNLLAVRNSLLIKMYMNLHPVIPYLLRFIRYWSQYHELSGSFKIKSYCFVLLVLVFCGRRGLIPPLKEIRDYIVCPPEYIDGWNSSYPLDANGIMAHYIPRISRDLGPLQLSEHIMELLLEFVGFCASTNFEKSVICTNTFNIVEKGVFQSRSRFTRNSHLDIAGNWTYDRNAIDLPNNEQFKANGPLCVQDPFVLTSNVGGVTNRNTLLHFQKICRETRNKLGAFMKSKGSRIAPVLDWFFDVPLHSNNGDKGNRWRERNKVGVRPILNSEARQLANDVIMSIRQNLGADVNQTFEDQLILDAAGSAPVDLFIGFCITPNTTFTALFAKAMRDADLCSHYGSRSLLQRMKSLWFRLVEDFLHVLLEDYEVAEKTLVRDGEDASTPANQSKHGDGLEKKYPEIAFDDLKKARLSLKEVADLPVVRSSKARDELISNVANLDKSLAKSNRLMMLHCIITHDNAEGKEKQEVVDLEQEQPEKTTQTPSVAQNEDIEILAVVSPPSTSKSVRKQPQSQTKTKVLSPVTTADMITIEDDHDEDEDSQPPPKKKVKLSNDGDSDSDVVIIDGNEYLRNPMFQISKSSQSKESPTSNSNSTAMTINDNKVPLQTPLTRIDENSNDIPPEFDVYVQLGSCNDDDLPVMYLVFEKVGNVGKNGGLVNHHVSSLATIASGNVTSFLFKSLVNWLKCT